MTVEKVAETSLWTQIATRRMLVCVLLGFSSGLPLYVLLSLLQAWLSSDGLDIKKIAIFSLVQLPYAWKFIWAPVLDRFSFLRLGGWLGHQRSWMFGTQFLLLGLIASLGFFSPKESLLMVFILCFMLSFVGATQDIVLDAHRRNLLSDEEQGLGSSVFVNAYKLAGFVPGSLSLILADHYAWETVFIVTSSFMLVGLIGAYLAPEINRESSLPKTFREAVVGPFVEFFSRDGLKKALWILAFMFLYKLGDVLATALATKFYLDLGFSKTDIGLIAKNAGLWANVVGGLLGGIWMLRMGVNKSLWVFGVVQASVTLCFWVLAQSGNNPWVLGGVIALDAFGTGLGTCALVAFIARETSSKFSATQFALFSSLASMPRVVVSAFTGTIVEVVGGWQPFFILCFFLAIPGMLLLLKVAPWHEQRVAS